MQGRDREQSAIGALLDDARTGVGGAMVLWGDPGAGKSALLEEACGAAGDMTVIRTNGIESEAPLAFAALERLVRPLMGSLDRLPDPQARALRVAFGQEVGDAGDRFLVFLGVLTLLGEAANERPVLAIVDDAQWLDDASAAALLFVARRLQLDPVALLFAARYDDERGFDGGDLPRLALEGLEIDAASALLAEHARCPVAKAVGAQLLISTGGNPLALVELSEALTEDQLAGTAPLPTRLPVTESVNRVFLDRARRLSGPAQQMLLVAAADDSTRVATVLRAAADLGVDPHVLTELERSQLVTVSEDQLVLRHPLVRSALYSAAPLAERRRVHAALAAVLTGEQDADRRAWHRAAAVVEPDETVVGELVDAALRSQARGGYEAAAAAWARAAELSTRSAVRAEMYLRAGRAAWVAGRPAQARDLTGQACDEAEEPLLRADARRLRARIEWNTGSVSLAHKMLLSAARDVAPHDQQRARELAAEAMAIAAWDGSSGVGLDPSVFVATASDDAPARDRCYSALLHGLRHVVSREWRRAGPPLRRAFKIHEEMPGDFELVPNLSVAALHIGDYEAARDYHERLLTEARHTGVMVMVLYALTRLVFSDLAEGRWASAVGHASEAVRLGQETGHPVLAAAPQAWLLLLAGLRGEDDFERLAAELKDARSSQGAGILDVLLRDVEHWAHGIRTLNRPSFALHHLTQMSHPVTQRMAGLDRIETAVRDDQPQLAMSWVQDLEDFAEGTEQLWPAAMSEHGRALLATGAQVENHFLRALELHERLDRPFERARTQLAYGEFLRRGRRRVDARQHLRGALATFQDLGAGPWVERAGQELRASGETARSRADSYQVSLTPQERQVALMVSDGLSNREVAAQLFLSTRTVDFHLRNVFRKTGVSSRVELAALRLQ